MSIKILSCADFRKPYSISCASDRSSYAHIKAINMTAPTVYERSPGQSADSHNDKPKPRADRKGRINSGIQSRRIATGPSARAVPDCATDPRGQAPADWSLKGVELLKLSQDPVDSGPVELSVLLNMDTREKVAIVTDLDMHVNTNNKWGAEAEESPGSSSSATASQGIVDNVRPTYLTETPKGLKS